MSGHIDSLVDDYVLDLLAADRQREVEQHAQRCSRCGEMLRAEQARTARLTSTLRQATAAPADRLATLWPDVALAAGVGASRRPWSQARQWRMALVSMAAALFFLSGLWGVMGHLDEWLGGGLPTADVATMFPYESGTPTHTFTPTSYVSAGYTPVAPAAGTPAPVIDEPQPQPNPMAPSSN